MPASLYRDGVYVPPALLADTYTNKLHDLKLFETAKAHEWELIDGLQRLSTILEFMGLLKVPKTRKPIPPSALSGTAYLPSLNEAKWNDAGRFPKALQFSFRRARLEIRSTWIMRWSALETELPTEKRSQFRRNALRKHPTLCWN